MLIQPDYSLDLLHMADQQGFIPVRPGSVSEAAVHHCVVQGFAWAVFEPGRPVRYQLTPEGMAQRNATSYCLAKVTP